MSKVLLIYPYFKPLRDRSVFRFPPLGICYLASTLMVEGYQVQLLDCTFMNKQQALQQAREARAEVVGIYCMVTLLEDCLWFAKQLRPYSQFLVAGGPLPTCDPPAFLEDFDVVVRGEGERALVELLKARKSGTDLASVPGITIRRVSNNGDHTQAEIITSPDRPFNKNLDDLPFPARQLLPNQDYIRFGQKRYGYGITTVMSTRGCPFECEFCSNVIFGGSYRERSAANVVDEIEEALSLGYQRISFADDVFTMHKKRVVEFCEEILKRDLHFMWECLARVDSIDEETYGEMYRAGCRRVYFGIESGDNAILKLMKKKITVDQARHAVEAAKHAGLEVGAFFILFYPGETDQSVLNTL
ncbi:MAG TPA: radical SAM protein, partial [Anaerolineales bacterium]|nr:radical SAM protein [Anaerolineales bacterium]